MYRINYGNGQVSQTYATKRGAMAELQRTRGDLYGGYAFLQKYLPGTADDPGDWINVSSDRRNRSEAHAVTATVKYQRNRLDPMQFDAFARMGRASSGFVSGSTPQEAIATALESLARQIRGGS